MRDQKGGEFDDFNIPDNDPPLGIYVDNNIEELRTLLAEDY